MVIKCKSLAEVRENIDRIDEKLVKLLAERGKLIEQVINFKPEDTNRDASQRVSDVIAHIRQLAEQEDLDPNTAEKIYRSIINAFRIEQLLKEIPEYKDLKKSYY